MAATEKSAGEGLHEFGALNTLLFVSDCSTKP